MWTWVTRSSPLKGRTITDLVFKQTYSNYGALQLCVVAAVTRPFGRQFNFVNEKKDQSPA